MGLFSMFLGECRAGTRSSLRPLQGEGDEFAKLSRKPRRGNESACLSTSLRAKRSDPALPQQSKLDCFVAPLLAMTLSAFVMPGLDPGIHDLFRRSKNADGRDKPGHDGG